MAAVARPSASLYSAISEANPDSGWGWEWIALIRGRKVAGSHREGRKIEVETPNLAASTTSALKATCGWPCLFLPGTNTRLNTPHSQFPLAYLHHGRGWSQEYVLEFTVAMKHTLILCSSRHPPLLRARRGLLDDNPLVCTMG